MRPSDILIIVVKPSIVLAATIVPRKYIILFLAFHTIAVVEVIIVIIAGMSIVTGYIFGTVITFRIATALETGVGVVLIPSSQTVTVVDIVAATGAGIVIVA